MFKYKLPKEQNLDRMDRCKVLSKVFCSMQRQIMGSTASHAYLTVVSSHRSAFLRYGGSRYAEEINIDLRGLDVRLCHIDYAIAVFAKYYKKSLSQTQWFKEITNECR